MLMGIEHLIYVIALILLIVFVSIWSFHFLALIYGKYKFHKKSKRVVENDAPGVTIMKPLMGVDDNLRENLETFFTCDYPLFEIIFCIQDPNDPAILVVRHLIEQYPNVDARLFYGGKPVGINPKINNLVQGYDHIKYELLLISDAGLRIEKDTLWDIVSFMTDKVGLVHQMPFTTDRNGFAGSLEKVYFGTCHCRMYLFINLIGVNCVTGMSCLMRKCVLDKIGGLKSFSNYLAEDYFIAKSYLDDNWLIQLSHQPALQNTSNFSVPSWQKRMIRWCKLRLRLTPMAWLEPTQECFWLGIMSSWTVNYLFGWNSLVFFLIHVLCWFLSDYTLLKITQNGRLPFNKFEYLLCWLYRETICYYLFLKAINPTVKWRDGTYRLKWGGLSELVKDNSREKSAIDPTTAAVVAAGEAKLAAATSPTQSASPTTPLLSNETPNLSTTVQMSSSSPPSAHKLTLSSSNTAVNLLGTNQRNQKSINTTNAQQQQQQHKRTSSYSVIMKSSASTVTTTAYNSDAENTNSQPGLYGSYQHQPYHHHQHHHSMSAPVSASITNGSAGGGYKKHDV